MINKEMVEQENLQKAEEWLTEKIGADKVEKYRGTWTAFSDNEPLCDSDGGKSLDFEPGSVIYTYKRLKTEEPGIARNSDFGLISTGGDNGVDIVTRNMDLLADVGRKLRGPMREISNDMKFYLFFKDGKQIMDSAIWKFPEGTNLSKMMFLTAEFVQMMRKRGRVALMETGCLKYKCRNMFETAGIEQAEEGKDYIIIRDGDTFSYPNMSKYKKPIELNFSEMGLKQDGVAVQNYNGGAGIVYDGRSDFLILTTDTKDGGIFDKLAKGLPSGGFVPAVYNGYQRASFVNKQQEEKFVSMIIATKGKSSTLEHINEFRQKAMKSSFAEMV